MARLLLLPRPQHCSLLDCPDSRSPPLPLLMQQAPPSTSRYPTAITVVTVLIAAFLVVCLYRVLVKYCTTCDLGRRQNHSRTDFRPSGASTELEASRGFSNGLGEAVVKMIPVYKYVKDDEQSESQECSVCLSEFKENEIIRRLPKCNHGFHLPCIDAWLTSNASCPLCRISMTYLVCLSIPIAVPPASSFPEDRAFAAQDVSGNGWNSERDGRHAELEVSEEPLDEYKGTGRQDTTEELKEGGREQADVEAGGGTPLVEAGRNEPTEQKAIECKS